MSVTPLVLYRSFLGLGLSNNFKSFKIIGNLHIWNYHSKTCTGQQLYTRNNCYKVDLLKNLTWQEFLNCEHNLGNNRQVRTLANYNIIGCSVLKCWLKSSNCSHELQKIYEQKLLQSAKHTLLGLSFFGLAEYPQLSEYLFIKIFDENKFKFKKSFAITGDHTGDTGGFIDEIKKNNHLDTQLYEFAKELFFKRVEYFQNSDDLKF
jgi:hypothetical protein